MVHVPRAGERQSSDWLKADCEVLEKCLPPRSTSRDSSIKKCRVEKLLFSMCGRYSQKSSIAVALTVVK